MWVTYVMCVICYMCIDDYVTFVCDSYVCDYDMCVTWTWYVYLCCVKHVGMWYMYNVCDRCDVTYACDMWCTYNMLCAILMFVYDAYVWCVCVCGICTNTHLWTHMQRPKGDVRWLPSLFTFFLNTWSLTEPKLTISASVISNQAPEILLSHSQYWLLCRYLKSGPFASTACTFTQVAISLAPKMSMGFNGNS